MKTAIVFSLLLCGCASLPKGIEMTDDERTACEASKDCTVWTVEELQKLIGLAMKRGYEAGRKSL